MSPFSDVTPLGIWDETDLLNPSLDGNHLNPSLEDNSSLLGLKRAFKKAFSSTSGLPDTSNSTLFQDNVTSPWASNSSSFSVGGQPSPWLFENQPPETTFLPFPPIPTPQPQDLLTGNAENAPPVKSTSADPLTDTTQQRVALSTSTTTSSASPFTSGVFTVGFTGQVSFDYLFDGGFLEGELAIINLAGMEAFVPGSVAFIKEAARRALSDSELGRIVLRDATEGSRFNGSFPWEGNYNAGTYQGVKTVSMRPGDQLGLMLVPHGTVQQVFQEPWYGGTRRPFFSMVTSDESDSLDGSQYADVTGEGCAIAVDDLLRGTSSADGDYNDVVFQMKGASGSIKPLSELINPTRDWRTRPLGQQILATACNDELELYELNRFLTRQERSFVIPAAPAILSFTIANKNFDTTDPDSIKDAFEAALVDSTGRSLVHTVGTGRDAFFNWTEGETPVLAPGVTFDGSKVTVDLSQLQPGTNASLQLRLVNNDSDTATAVFLQDIELQPRPEGLPPAATGVDAPASTASAIDFSRLEDVSASIKASYGQTSFDADNKVLMADLAALNAGSYPVKGPLLVGIHHLSDPTVRVKGADGVTPEGMPYYDLTRLVNDGTLESGEATLKRTLEFYNPSGGQFSYDLVFLSQLNAQPEFTTTANLEALFGRPYVYDADATDADGDELTYSLLSGPDGLVVDSATGKITWNPTAANVGTHVVRLRVADALGGEAIQQFSLSAMAPPPNRPPLFTSIPVVDANVNTPYSYQALASDADSDGLTFSVVSGPEGMVVDAQGLVTWQPTGDQVGQHEVTLQVEDGAGGRAQQSFVVLAQQELGNHAPLIISTPVTQFNLPPQGNPPSGNINPLAIDLDLGLGEVATETVSLTLPETNAAGATDMVFVVDRSTSMGSEFQWLSQIVLSLEQELSSKGIGPNRYGIVTYDQNGQFLNVEAAGNDVTVDLYGPDNQYLLSRTITSGDWPANQLDTTLPTNGNYTLLLRSNNAPSPVNYGFQLTGSGIGSSGSTSAPSTTTTQPLELGIPVTGSIAATTEKDIFSFSANAGTTLFYDALEADYDAINVRLLSPNGTTIFNTNSDTDSPVFTLTETGTYSLIFDSSGATSDYKFQLLDVAGQPLVLDTPIAKSLNSGWQTALYHFDGTPGTRLYFDSLANANGYWELIGPDNQSLRNTSLSNDFETTLPFEGSYTLKVYSYNNSSAPVPYSFKVFAPSTTTGTLALNAPITGSIDVPREVDIFTFDGTSGTKLYYDALEADYDFINVKLVTPSGNTIFDQNSDSNSSLFTLTETGTYRLIIDSSTQTTGDYKFQLLAPGLNSGQNLSVPVTARLDSSLSTALYQFNGTAGARLVFDSLANANGYWTLYRPDNQYLSGNSLSYDFEATLPIDGAYTLMVTGDNSSTAGVDYSFKVDAPNAIVTSNSTAPSNSETVPLQLNAPITGSLASATEKDIFTFSGTIGQQLYYDALEADYDNIYVRLLSPNGTTVFDNSNSDSDSRLLTLSEAGVYSLVVYSSGATSDYKFQLLDVTQQPLVLDTPIASSLNSGWQTAFYHFDGTIGTRLYFDSLANANGYWELYGPTNQYFASNSLSNDLETTLPFEGSYTLKVYGYNNSSAPVPYSFKVFAPPTPTQRLDFNTPITGSIDVPREVDIFTFDGTSGTKLYYDALEADNDTINAKLVSPAGNTIFTTNSDSDTSLHTLTETGTYRLIVDGSAQTTGDYKFQLLATNADLSLAPNQFVLDQLSSRYQTALYHFNGTAGQRVAFAPNSDLFFGTAQEAAATAKVIRNNGGDEDGYAAINVALNHDLFRPEAALNVILVTDEDRDVMQGNLNFSNILSALDAKNIPLSAAVNGTFGNGSNSPVLGVDGAGNAYIADGAGGFISTLGGQFVASGDGTTKTDYVDLTWATGGIAWDINQLRAGGLTAQSFSSAFTSQLLGQIDSQLAIDVVASDDRIAFENLTGTLEGMNGGETAAFDVKLTGDGSDRVFDLLFVRPNTNTILGSVPVAIRANSLYFYPIQAVDPDGDALTYRLIQAPEGASIDPQTHRISWKPTQAGQYEFVVQVADGRGGISTQTYSVEVTSGADNADPVITSTAPAEAAVGQPYTYRVTATDADSDPLNFYLVDPPQGASIDRKTGVITWSPQAVSNEPQSFTVRVLDGRGGEATQTVTVTVKPDVENVAPQFNSTPTTSSVVGQLYRYEALALDPNGDALQFELVVKPDGMTVEPEKGTVVWQPTSEQVGTHTVVLRVSDGRGGVDLQSFQMTVVPPNTAPVITSTSPKMAQLGQLYRYQLRAIDAEGDAVSFQPADTASGISIDANNLLTWTPNALGSQQLSVVASDGRGGETTQSFTVEVVQSLPNQSPEITSIPRQEIGLGQHYFYRVEATDPNTDPLTFSLVTAPQGMTIDETGQVFWQPQPTQFGANTVLIRVADGRGGTVEQAFTVEVVGRATNTAPSIDSTPEFVATAHQLYQYDLKGSDPDSDPLFWSLDSAPVGMSIDPERGTIRWTPTPEQVGDHEVAVRVTDAYGAFVGQAFTLTVRGANLPPTILSHPPTVAAVNQAYKYAVLAKDVEQDELTFSLTRQPQGMTIDAQTGLIEWTPSQA